MSKANPQNIRVIRAIRGKEREQSEPPQANKNSNQWIKKY